MPWDTIITWIAIILLLDAAFGLWNYNRLKEMAPKINIFWIAMVEGAMAIFLMMVRQLF